MYDLCTKDKCTMYDLCTKDKCTMYDLCTKDKCTMYDLCTKDRCTMYDLIVIFLKFVAKLQKYLHMSKKSCIFARFFAKKVFARGKS